MLNFRNWLLKPAIDHLNLLRSAVMATTLETIASIEGLTAQVAKSRAEVVAKVQALEDALASSGAISPEITAALDALKSEVQATDDLIPDAPTP